MKKILFLALAISLPGFAQPSATLHLPKGSPALHRTVTPRSGLPGSQRTQPTNSRPMPRYR